MRGETPKHMLTALTKRFHGARLQAMIPARFAQILATAMLWVGLALNASAVPTPFDYWSFDNPSNREQTVVGTGTLGKNGTISYVQGANGATDGAAQIAANKGNY